MLLHEWWCDIDTVFVAGESERFLQKAIQEQGRGRVLDTINEIQERHDAVKDIEKNLRELHQVFLDMAVLVEHQGAQLDDIESHVGRASSFIRGGTDQLQTARVYQKNTRKWTCIAIIILIIIITVVVLAVLKPWNNSSGGGGGGGGGGTTGGSQPNSGTPPNPPQARRLLR
jgi:syntaxin 1B/2/3